MLLKKRARSVLIIVQNLPVPLDRRVWLECQALVDSGYTVSVICPKGPGDPAFQELDGVAIYKYDPPTDDVGGALGYIREFVLCWLLTARLSLAVWKRTHFDVIQACNPPDTYWALAALWRLRGVRFVYDQHDLNPELFRAKFGQPRGPVRRAQHRLLVWLEHRTYRGADHVIVTNESYRLIALTRGECAPEDVTVVRSGPDTSQMRPVSGLPGLRHGAERLVCYLGIMGSQDGVDDLLRSIQVLVRDRRRTDTHFALLGFGESLEDLRALSSELEIDEWVTFTGRADRKMIAEYLSTADIGVCPDPQTVFNDFSTMNKVMEYMAYALPVVAFDLRESRASAGDAARYVAPGDVDAFAAAIDELLDDDDTRAEMSLAGRRRVATYLDWFDQSRAYVGVYDAMFGIERPLPAGDVWPQADRRTQRTPLELQDAWGHELVDLRAESGLTQFVLTRAVESTMASRLRAVPRIPLARVEPVGALTSPPGEDEPDARLAL
jgi:glycosyltransferase involved in cell wall biosynthesis